MFNTAKNTTAYAKLSFCKKLKLFKMLVAFKHKFNSNKKYQNMFISIICK